MNFAPVSALRKLRLSALPELVPLKFPLLAPLPCLVCAAGRTPLLALPTAAGRGFGFCFCFRFNFNFSFSFGRRYKSG